MSRARANDAEATSAVLFSKPIAAARLAGGGVLAAGLVVPRASVVASLLTPEGVVSWSTVVLDGVAWSASAELRVLPAKDGGGAIAWHGLRGGQRVSQVVMVDVSGRVLGDAFDAGTAACATADGFVWIERAKNVGTNVRLRPWNASVTQDILVIPPDRDPELVCSAHRAFVLGEGEDDVTVVEIAGATSNGPYPFIADRDFPSDEEREHELFTAGDSLGVVRVGHAGALALRELASGDGLPWKKLGTRIADDDDLVAVEASESSVFVAFTRDEGERCAGAPAASVHGILVGRARGDGGASVDAQGGGRVLEVAPYDCAREPGPFWSADLGGSEGARSFLIGWIERVHKAGPTTAPIVGLAYRTIAATARGWFDTSKPPRTISSRPAATLRIVTPSRSRVPRAPTKCSPRPCASCGTRKAASREATPGVTPAGSIRRRPTDPSFAGRRAA